MDFAICSLTDRRTPTPRLALRHPTVPSNLRFRQLYSVPQVSISRTCRRRTTRSEATPPQLQKSQLSEQAVIVIQVSPFVSLVVVPASAGVVAGYFGMVVADLANLGGPLTLASGILFAAAGG